MAVVYTCPSSMHRGNPVPLADDAAGVYSCVGRHQYHLIHDEEMGYVFKDMKTGIMHEAQPLDFADLQFRPEKQFGAVALNKQSVDVSAKEPEAKPEPPPPPPPPQKKIRKISTSSMLVLKEGLNFNQLNLNPIEWKIIARIDGFTKVKEIVDASRLDPKEAYDALAGLIKRGLVDIKEAE